MAFKIPAANELSRPVRLAVQAVKDYVDGLAKPSDWTAPTFSGTWVNYDNTGTWQPAQYRKVGDVVQIRGLVKSGSAGTSIFTLPSGFRPPQRLLFTVASDTGYGRLDVLADGSVQHYTGGTTYYSINVSFSTV